MQTPADRNAASFSLLKNHIKWGRVSYFRDNFEYTLMYNKRNYFAKLYFIIHNAILWHIASLFIGTWRPGTIATSFLLLCPECRSSPWVDPEQAFVWKQVVRQQTQGKQADVWKWETRKKRGSCRSQASEGVVEPIKVTPESCPQCGRGLGIYTFAPVKGCFWGCRFPVTSGSLCTRQRELPQPKDSPPTKSHRCSLLGMKAHSFHSFPSNEGGRVSQHLLWSHFLPHGGHQVYAGWLLASDRCLRENRTQWSHVLSEKRAGPQLLYLPLYPCHLAQKAFICFGS